jgi:hypothetical protein
MTGQLSAGIGGSDRDLAKLNAAFFDFARSHRRQNLIDKISNNDDDDASKSRYFYKLFNIQHVTAEEQDLTEIQDLRVLNKLLAFEKKSLGKQYWAERKIETMRARIADLGFKFEEIDSKIDPDTLNAGQLEGRKILQDRRVQKKYLQKVSKLKRKNNETFLPKLESVQTSADTMRRRIQMTRFAKQAGRYILFA